MCSAQTDMLVIDGSHGEGGGQILRTAVSLAAMTERPLRIERIRAGRRKPGLAAQHLTAIRAAAVVAGARLNGDALGSEMLEFQPGGPPISGCYRFDVAEAREGGSAGAATLVLQTITLPLVLAGRKSTVIVNGGTHVPWSPSFDYFETIWLDVLRGLGVNAAAELNAWGFFPAGRGEITLRLDGLPTNVSGQLSPLVATEQLDLAAIEGRAVAANLPAHIAERMADRARMLLQPLGVPVSIKTESPHSVSPGAWLFLKAVYGNVISGFGAHGKRGKPSEDMAEEAVADLLNFHHSAGAIDCHLADQMLLPLSFAEGASAFTCSGVTRHLETNAWVIEQFGAARIDIARRLDGTGHVKVIPNR